MKFKGEFLTDTAKTCIVDIACLKHRLDDDIDWWSTPKAELEEVKRGNVAFLNLSSDGKYSFTFAEEIQGPQVEINHFSYQLSMAVVRQSQHLKHSGHFRPALGASFSTQYVESRRTFQAALAKEPPMSSPSQPTVPVFRRSKVWRVALPVVCQAAQGHAWPRCSRCRT